MIEQFKEALLADLNSSASRRDIVRRIHLIYEDSIEPEVKRAVRAEVTADYKYNQLITRIPNVNLIQKITDKLAKVYNKPATRKVKTGISKTDQELVDYYSSALTMDHTMGIANKVLEWGKSCALEPYLDPKTGQPKLRVLTPYQFRAYSFNPDNYMSVDAVTKIMRPMEIKTTFQTKLVNVYHTYTDDEFMVWNDLGEFSVSPNPFGRIPVLILNRSAFSLNSYAPESDINSAVLVPKYYADLFYAMSFNAHSVFAAIDLTLPEKLSYDPGGVMDLKTDLEGTEAGKQGRLEVVKPTIEVSGALELIKQAVFDILESRGIKPPQTTSNLERPNATAALIENADASSYISQACAFFHKVEEELWRLLATMHSVWLQAENKIPIKSQFSKDLKLDIVFGEVKPVEVKAETLVNIEKQRGMGLMSDKQALAEIYPHFTDAQLDAWLAEARKDAAQNIAAPIPFASGAGGGGAPDNSNDPEQDS